ncbi:hypothetical protein ACFWCA_32605 [Streptomyces phaeochromogenes]|uniref:hypothetical protein n=1 Tax=Streptomyces phaeochromogenes TaxID=1923 RepID=UPI00368F60C1
MKRFLIGLALGSGSSAVAWGVTHSLGWTAAVGITVFILVWLGEFILDDLL